ncbi:MAG: metal-dependent transcriptional regulator [Firmicutes bacterium]|nr:metal-dependent transcriptional regulator [Bacillota bacterium]
MELNRSREDYLKTMLVLQWEKGEIRSTDVAEYLDVTRPSVSHTVRFLKEGGFLTMDKSKKICLTPLGRQVAGQLYERHCIIKEFLLFLGVEPEIAGQDACRIEHDISGQSFEKLKAYWEKHKGSASRHRRELCKSFTRKYTDPAAPSDGYAEDDDT